MPGVAVLFSVYCKFIVDSAATLRAVGTPADSIRFDVLPSNEHWHGIRFLSAADSSKLECCHLGHGLADGDGEDAKGGAIYCNNSSPTISNSRINWNAAMADGGGIHCGDYSSPIIRDNIIYANGASSYGGIGCHNNSNPIIRGNIISENSGGFGGGVGCQLNSNPIINDNFIRANDAALYGAGIYCWDNSSPSIRGNTIIENWAFQGWPPEFTRGGAIYCGLNSNPNISRNIISGNSAWATGGGIYCEINSNPAMNSNTISGNSALSGGGIYCFNSIPTLVDCILWGNSGQQIYGSPIVTYSDIQGGYAGTGNINTWPAFVDTAQSDYRLQWGSPCIDTGDPNPIYNDPDGTRADMGAWYYDQSLPVRILLTPYNQPIEIPVGGGSFDYAIQATNIESTTLSVSVWCDVTLPNGNPYGLVLGPVTISLASLQTLSRLRTQTVPAGAPAGMYHYNAYAVAVGDTSSDGFTFVKLGSGVWGLGFGGWTNTGEDLDRPLPSQAAGPRAMD